MQATQAQHQAAHRLQTFKRELKPNQEQQEDHAKLGNRGDAFRVNHCEPIKQRVFIDEGPKRKRPQQRPGTKIAKHRADTDAAQQGHDHARRAQHDQRIAIGLNIEPLSQSLPLRPFGPSYGAAMVILRQRQAFNAAE